jgi:hypothetical protein
VRHRGGKERQQDDLETEEAKQQHLESRIEAEWWRLPKIIHPGSARRGYPIELKFDGTKPQVARIEP